MNNGVRVRLRNYICGKYEDAIVGEAGKGALLVTPPTGAFSFVCLHISSTCV